MNARSYNLNPEHAKSADSGGNRITETGKYIGKFIRAEAVTSKQKTEGLEFTFVSNAGQEADFLSCWTYNVEGKELFGLKVLNALMTCMKVRSIAPSEATIEKFDNGEKKQVKTTIFRDLMDKPIGLLLQREAYEKNNGAEGYKFNIVGCFEASTELTASEILDKKTTPERLGRMVASLKDKPASKRSGSSHPNAPGNDGGADNGFSDDIPW